MSGTRPAIVVVVGLFVLAVATPEPVAAAGSASGITRGTAPQRRTRRLAPAASTAAPIRLLSGERAATGGRLPQPIPRAELLPPPPPDTTTAVAQRTDPFPAGSPPAPAVDPGLRLKLDPAYEGDTPPRAAAGESPRPLPAREMTLDELLSLALAHNPTLRQASALVDMQRGTHWQAGLYPNPTAGYLASEIGQEGRSGQQGGFVTQDIVTAGKLKLNRAVAAHAVQQAHWLQELQSYRVQNAVRLRYYELLGAQQNVTLAAELKRITEHAAESTRRLRQAGERTRLDELQAEIEVDQAEIVLANSRNRQAATVQRLTAATGVADLEGIRVPGVLDEEVPAYEFDAVWEWLLANSPEVQAAQSAVARAQWAVERARNEPIPNVNLQFAQQYDNATGYQISQVQAGIPIPVFNRNQGNILAACAEVRRAQEEVQRVQLSLRDRLASAFQRYSNARQQVVRYRDQILPRAKESLAISSEGYERGELNFLQVLTAQRTYRQASMAYVDALTQAWRSVVDLSGWLLTEEGEVDALPAAPEGLGAPIPIQP